MIWSNEIVCGYRCELQQQQPISHDERETFVHKFMISFSLSRIANKYRFYGMQEIENK